MNWQAISAISAVVTTSVVLVGAAVAFRQFHVALEARYSSGTLGLAHQLESSGSVRATRHLLGQNRERIADACHSTDWPAALDALIVELSAGRSNFARVRDDLATLEYAALFALHGMVPAKLGTAYFLPIVVSAWPDIRDIATAHRREIGSEIYLQHLEALYGLAVGERFESARARRKCVVKLRNRSASAISGGLGGGW